MLTVIQSGPGTWQIWSMIEEANTALRLLPPVAYMRDDMVKLKNFAHGGSTFMFTSNSQTNIPGRYWPRLRGTGH